MIATRLRRRQGLRAPRISPYATAVIALPGLVSYFRMSAGAGTTEFDQGGGGNTATYSGGFTLNQVGALTAGGDVDGAAAFNGTTGKLAMGTPSNLNIVGDITIGGWINPTDRTAYQCIMNCTNVSGYPAPWDFYLNTATGFPTLTRGNGSAGSYGVYTAAGTGSTAIPTGSYSFVVATMTGTTVQHYLNGATNGVSGTISASPITSGGSPSIGRGQSTFTKGTVDEIFICNQAVSAAAISNLYSLR